MNKYIASFKVLKTGHWHSEYFNGKDKFDITKNIIEKYGTVSTLNIELSI